MRPAWMARASASVNQAVTAVCAWWSFSTLPSLSATAASRTRTASSSGPRGLSSAGAMPTRTELSTPTPAHAPTSTGLRSRRWVMVEAPVTSRMNHGPGGGRRRALAT